MSRFISVLPLMILRLQPTTTIMIQSMNCTALLALTVLLSPFYTQSSQKLWQEGPAKKATKDFVDGVQVGFHKMYRRDGSPASTTQYKDGEKVGKTVFHDAPKK